MSYKTELLEYVAEVASGGGAPQAQDSFSKSGTPFVRAGSLPLLLKGVKEENLELLTDEVARNHRLRLFPKDTVLFAKSGMSATKGHIYQLKNPCYVVNHLAAIVPTEKISPSYLKHWFQVFSPSRLIQDESYPSIRLYDIKKIEIPLPPLPEQKRIAEVLDKADAVREKRRLALQKLDTLLQSVFLDMFGDPVKNPKGWETQNLNLMADFVGGGTPRREVPEFYTGNICWATSKDMKGKFLTDTQEHITEEAIQKSATKLVPAGTILVVVKSKILMRYLPILINKVPTCFGQDLKGIVLKDNTLTSYIARHLIIGQKTLLQQARGINTEGLTLEHLRNYKIMLPERKLIQQYTEIEQKIQEIIPKATNHLIQSENLFQSLQHRAFKGELFNNEFQTVESQKENVWHQTSLF